MWRDTLSGRVGSMREPKPRSDAKDGSGRRYVSACKRRVSDDMNQRLDQIIDKIKNQVKDQIEDQLKTFTKKRIKTRSRMKNLLKS